MAVDGYLNFDTKINTKGFNAGTKQITNGLAGMKSMLGKIGGAVAVAFSVRELVSFSKEAINLASDVQEVQNVVDVSFGHLKSQMEEFAATSIQTYGISKLVAKQTGSTYMAMAKGMQIADKNAAEMATTLTGLSADMASFYNKEQSVTATALNSVFTGETETLKQFGIVMTEANLQQFAYTQGINKKISAMSQAEKVQLRYNYVMQQTALAQGDFARTQNSWANQTRILSEMWKEFAGTVGTILMNTLLPAVQNLNKAMTWLNTVAQDVLETLSAVFGWDVEANNATAVSDAIGTAVDNQNALTDAMNETAEAQERQLMGFDKINKLNDSGSSASSGASSVVGGSYEIPVDIDTEKVEKKLTDFQQKLKDFVSSLKITFNDVLFEWKELTGEQIAEKLLASLGAVVGGIIGFSIGGVPGAAIGASIGVGLSLVMSSLTFNHDGKLNVEEIISLIVMALGAVAGGVIGFSMGGAVGAAIGIAIGTSITFGMTEMSFDGDGSLNADEIIGMIVSALCGIAGGVIGFVVGGPAGAVVGATLGMGLSMFINKIDWGALWNDISTGFTNILKNIKTWFKDKKADLKTAWDGFTSGIKNKVVSIKGKFTQKKSEITDAWKEKISGVKEKVANLKGKFTQKKKDITALWKDKVSGVKEKVANLKGKFTQKKDAISASWSNLVSGVKEKLADLKGRFTQTKEGISTSWNNLVSGVKEKTADISLKFSQTKENIKSAAQERYNAITEVFSTISTWFKDKFSEAWQNVKNVFSSGGEVFDGIKDGILNGLKTVINALIDGINDVIAVPFNGINTALEKVKNVSIAGSQPFYDKISTITVPQIPKLATGTVVPANYGEFLAILGDNKREAEVVSPLSTIKKAVAEVIGVGGEQNINLTVELDGEVVYRKIVKKNKQNTKMTGVNELATA